MSEPMSKERLREITVRLNCAYSGWFEFVMEPDRTGFFIRKSPGDYFAFEEGPGTATMLQNAHSDISALLQEVERLRLKVGE